MVGGNVYQFGGVFTPTTRTNAGRYADYSVYPTTENGWHDRYDRLWCAYLQEPYDTGEAGKFHLFRALDDQGNEIDLTRRTFDLVRFIVDTDVGGLLGGRILLEEEAEGAPLVEGEAVWRRSHVAGSVEAWAKTCAALGDVYFEAVRQSDKRPYRTSVVCYDPRNVTPIYDGETGTRLVGATVCTKYQDAPTVRADGTIEEGAVHEYRREIDATEIRVFRDRVAMPAESGPHGLGVPPIVHVVWSPWTEPDHGLPAAAGLDAAIMRIDSLITQIGAVANRYANPKPVLSGARLGASSDVEQFGRWMHGLPADAKAYYLESTGQGVDSMLAAIAAILDHVKSTAPEFLFAEDGAVSGEARSYKAAAFENKIGNARVRFFGGLSKVTEYAVLMDANTAADPDIDLFRIDAPPILPRNVKSDVETLYAAKEDIKRADRVRFLQTRGLIDPTVDPDEYAGEVEDETAERAAQFFAPVGKPAPATTGKPVQDPPEDDAEE
jgi:hypothetical protein